MAVQQDLVFAPLGGVGEIGMNLSIYGLGDERRRQWMIVDCGVSFASEEHLPGIDLMFPDIRYLVEERRNLDRHRADACARGSLRRAVRSVAAAARAGLRHAVHRGTD